MRRIASILVVLAVAAPTLAQNEGRPIRIDPPPAPRERPHYAPTYQSPYAAQPGGQERRDTDPFVPAVRLSDPSPQNPYAPPLPTR